MTDSHGSIPTPTTGGVALDSRTDADPTDEGARCDVCPHPWSAHDAIGVRFCTASRASSRDDRGCVCRP
jgi:hypothetical protein